MKAKKGKGGENLLINHYKLTERECDSFCLWFSGNTAKRSGMLLGLSQRTIEAHRNKAKHKLGITTQNNLRQFVNEKNLTTFCYEKAKKIECDFKS